MKHPYPIGPVEKFDRHCQFCTEVKWEGRTLKETENFYVVPTKGALVPNYLLLVSQVHHLSVGHLLHERRELSEEFSELKSLISDKLSSNDSSPIFFEHGAVSTSKRGGCCVDHMHLHCVPLPEKIDSSVLRTLKKGLNGKRLSKISELSEFYRRQRPYLYYETGNGEKHVFEADDIPSQYVRILIANELGTCEWNWRLFPRQDRIEECMSSLRL